jgi:hypothetical protein
LVAGAGPHIQLVLAQVEQAVTEIYLTVLLVQLEQV